MHPNTFLIIIFFTLIAIVGITAIVLNMLLFVVLCKMGTFRKSYFALVKSLTVADFFLPFMVPTIYAMVNNILYDYMMFVILFHLIALLLEMFVAIVKPLHYINWTRRRYIASRLATIWILPVPVVYLLSLLPESQIQQFGNHLIELKNQQDIIMIPLITLCFVAMVAVYIYIYSQVRKQQRFNQVQNQQAKANHRALVATILNVGSFFLCWFPIVVVEILYQYCKPLDERVMMLKDVIQVTVMINSVCDPIIYAIRLKEVRKQWRKIFCCFLHKRPFRNKIRMTELHQNMNSE